MEEGGAPTEGDDPEESGAREPDADPEMPAATEEDTRGMDESADAEEEPDGVGTDDDAEEDDEDDNDDEEATSWCGALHSAFGNFGEHVVHQVGRSITHPACRAGWTAAVLTRLMLDVNPVRDAAAREQGWKDIFAFFDKHLVGGA